MGNPSAEAFHTELTSIDTRLDRVLDAAGLIDRVLSRIEPLGGRKRGRPTKVYVEEIIRGAFAHFEAEIKELGVKVTLPQDSQLIQVDPAELQEVIINLLSNSLYWLRQVPKARRAIVVQCSRPQPGELDIVFADSGPGIPEKNKQSIFEPYFTTKPDGVGLGLVIAGEIVRPLLRRLSRAARRRTPGRRGIPRAAAKKNLASGGAMTRVLCVDDNPKIAGQVAEIFETWRNSPLGQLETTIETNFKKGGPAPGERAIRLGHARSPRGYGP